MLVIEFRLRITGTGPLLMHSGRLIDPLDPIAKAMSKVTAKRKKTEEDHLELARLEYLGGLYLIEGIGPYLPGENISRALVDAAKITRNGRNLTRALLITTNENPIAYTGPRTADGLWADENFRLRSPAKVQMSRVMRTRPMFRDWATTADGILDTDVLDFDEFTRIAATAGQMVGLGDWRPRYGRFTVQVQAL